MLESCWLAMDDQGRKISRRQSEEHQKKKKKKKRREEEEETELSHRQEIAALSSDADDAAAKQKRKEKKARKLLALQEQDASTLDDRAEEPFSRDDMRAKQASHLQQSALKVDELDKQLYEARDPHRRNNRVEDKKNEEDEGQHLQEGNLCGEIADEEEKMMMKKKKKRKKMDVEASLQTEIKKEQEQERNEEGDEKEDQRFKEGNLLRENNMLEKKSSKKRKVRKREEEEEAGLQEGSMLSSGGDHELGKEKKARKLLHSAEQNGVGQDCAEEEVFYEDKKLAKKARKAQGFLRKGGVDGDKYFVDGDEKASFKAKKQAKKTDSFKNSVHYEPDPEPDAAHELSCNEGEVSSKEPLPDNIEQVSTMNSYSDMDNSREETEKEMKRAKKRKTVRFQEQISEADQEQVRDILDTEPSENSKETVEEVWGVRFTSEEDEILKDAVWKYIKTKGWDEQEGLTKVLNSQKHKDAHNCWADINMCLPHRPRKVIRYRAHLLLEKGVHLGKWSKEEEELLKRLQAEHGRKWREISSLLDRHRTCIKEKWRSLKRSKGRGVWTQGELQSLSDMVHKCLRLKVSLGAENKKSNHQIIRDNINWEKIADTIDTHSHGSCCNKWYYHLQSSLVADGHWGNEDDSLLLKSLLESGASAEEEVEWDSLLDHRSGEVCLLRWKQMVKHLGENRTRQFLDKLDILARRYAPELMEASVEYNSNKENPSGSDEISLI